MNHNINVIGQWLCSSVGRAVAYNTRDPRFESRHRQNLLNICLLSTVCRKDENKEKEAGKDPFKKQIKTNPLASFEANFH